jgi:hypothetical protein
VTSSEPRTDRQGTTPDALVRTLLEPLLDARRQPATDQFDAVLASALGAGRITPELARQLRFWQRASVHEVTDHVRTVVPAVLPAALSALAEADRDATEAAAGAMAAWVAGHEAAPAADDEPVDAATPDEVAAEDAGVAAELSPEVSPELSPEPSPEVAPEAAAVPIGDAAAEAPLSTPPQDGVAMSPHARRRLFVAGLTSTA